MFLSSNFGQTKRLLTAFCFLSFFIAQAQKNISGVVYDSKTSAPLPFATIITDSNVGTVTDVDGKFQIKSRVDIQAFRVQYLGYKTKTVVTKSKKYHKVLLEENTESLKEVVVVARENPALEIIRQSIANRPKNNPEKKLNAFKFKSYSKLIITGNPDSIQGTVDSVFVKKNGKLVFKEVDSTNFELKKNLSRSHLYITEKISDDEFSKRTGRKETVLASRMAGLKNPIYELLALNIQDFSFYNNKYTLFGTDYVNPIAKNALKTYNYKILDTVAIQGQDAYMIYFKPKKKGNIAGLEGVLYLNMKNYAIQKAIAQLKGVAEIKATQEFKYFEKDDVWFPVKKEINMVRGKGDDNIALFNGDITFKNPQEDSSKVRQNTDQRGKVYLKANADNFDIEINPEGKIKNARVAIEINEDAGNRDEAYWNKYRTDSISARGQETYVVIDSIVKAENFERKLEVGLKVLQGYYPTKYFDFDLRQIIKFNQYEGLRLGLGGITNNKFSRKFRIEGYGAYGFRDKAAKYKIGAGYRLNRVSNTWLNVSYTDDLQESGSKIYLTDQRLFQLFEPRLINIDLFHRHRTLSLNIEHDITPKLKTTVDLSKTKIDPTYIYGFNPNGTIFSKYNLTTATAAFQWTPFSEYMQVPTGRSEIKEGFPKFTAQITKSFDGLIDGELDFTKFDLKALYIIRRVNKTSTEFLVDMGLAVGDTPLTHLYHAYPNNVNKDQILQRFSVAGRTSFETMYFNEFFSDRLATFHVKHNFAAFKVSKKIRPELVLISRFAIGNLSNPQEHAGLNFKTLNKGYTESGFELNRIYSGFGLSFAYRYGGYHLPEFSDNIAVNFTYYLSF